MCVCVCCLEPQQLSGEQRLKVAQERAQKNQAALQKDLDARRAGGAARIKQEAAIDGEDEPMDTSCPIPNGSVNGHPGAAHANANGGSRTEASSQELQDFVLKTFRKHFVVTLNEFKRLLNLHLASMPVGRSVFHSVSDHLLADAIVLSHCRQILVPVSISGELASLVRLHFLSNPRRAPGRGAHQDFLSGSSGAPPAGVGVHS